MKILVASKNEGKIEGVKLALAHYFGDFEIIAIEVNSDVSPQPFDEAIYQGASNRVDNLIIYAQAHQLKVDYYVAIEAGITDLLGNYCSISVAVIKDNEGNEGFGTSPGYKIPRQYIEKIKQSELSTVMSKVFNDHNIRVNNGVIHHLSRGLINRVELNKQATIMALTTFLNQELWLEK